MNSAAIHKEQMSSYVNKINHIAKMENCYFRLMENQHDIFLIVHYCLMTSMICFAIEMPVGFNQDNTKLRAHFEVMILSCLSSCPFPFSHRHLALCLW